MKVYKFVFSVGILNMLLPFIGIPNSYKQIIYVTSGVVAIVYALVVRTLIKEKENGLVVEVEPIKYADTPLAYQPTRKIEEVVQMQEDSYLSKRSPKPRTKRPAIKAKVKVNSYEDEGE